VAFELVLFGDTPRGLKPQRLLTRLRSRFPEWMERSSDSWDRSGGGISETAHPSMPAVSWAVPCPLLSVCLAERIDGPQLPLSASWQSATPVSFDTLSVARGAGGFSL
jgi:hypothetical protein